MHKKNVMCGNILFTQKPITRYYSSRAHMQARSQTMNTVTAAASSVGAYTYIRLQTHNALLCIYYVYIYIYIYISYVCTSVENALVGPQNQHSYHIALSITPHKTAFTYIHFLKMGCF
jgi:hypothetical protein